MKFILPLFVIFAFNAHSFSNEHHQLKVNCIEIMRAMTPYVENQMFEGNVLLAKNGKILCQQSLGFADERRKKPITQQTKFPIASLSKPVMAALVLKLSEQGEIELNKNLSHYLPNLKSSWANKVTIHHLLSNRSGIPGHFSLPGWREGKYKRSIPHKDLIQDIADMELKFEPGTQYLYTNLGWVLLGEVVTNITNKTLEQAFLDVVFNPLAMANTGLVYQSTQSMVNGFRWGTQNGWQPHQGLHMQIFNSGSGIYTTTQDFLKFLMATHQENWLSSKSKKEMFSVDTPYGWQIETLALSDDLNKDVHSYNGQLIGHSSYAIQLLADNVSLVILNNTGMGYSHKKAMATDILRAMYGVSVPDRSNLPSLLLHNSIIDGNWTEVIKNTTQSPIEELATASFVLDLAQQLNWSGNSDKAIELFYWLKNSLPTEPSLLQQFEMVCRDLQQHRLCK